METITIDKLSVTYPRGDFKARNHKLASILNDILIKNSLIQTYSPYDLRNFHLHQSPQKKKKDDLQQSYQNQIAIIEVLLNGVDLNAYPPLSMTIEKLERSDNLTLKRRPSTFDNLNVVDEIVDLN